MAGMMEVAVVGLWAEVTAVAVMVGVAALAVEARVALVAVAAAVVGAAGTAVVVMEAEVGPLAAAGAAGCRLESRRCTKLGRKGAVG